MITTAAGLFAAVPAVIFYNMYMNNIREFGARMDDFSLEILNTVERVGTPPAPQRPGVDLVER